MNIMKPLMRAKICKKMLIINDFVVYGMDKYGLLIGAIFFKAL